MRKSHVVVLALLIAVGSMLGTYALTRTTELGVQAQKASSENVDSVVAARTRQLNALEVSLRKALVKKPPPLPALPKIKAQPSQPAPRVYAPAPVAVTRVATPAPPVSRAGPLANQVKRALAHESDHARASSGGEQDD
jgi:hypothetical protein